jgi:hypothetical protein
MELVGRARRARTWFRSSSARARLITRGRYNWTDRYPWIVKDLALPAAQG